jgi:hypothetical protein
MSNGSNGGFTCTEEERRKKQPLPTYTFMPKLLNRGEKSCFIAVDPKKIILSLRAIILELVYTNFINCHPQWRTSVTFLLIDDNIQMNYGYNRCAHIFQKSRSHLKILYAGWLM